MSYTYNPHRHVKIWLSKDRDIFMNVENQLRLIRMSAVNPNDEINLVYDSSLLSSEALSALQVFCVKYKIMPADVQKDIIPACKNEEELNLLTIYQDEIQHLDQGGNLGAASDILRWLEPVYLLGTYTDFDVEVDTKNVPELFSVDTPILLNVGSTPSIVGETPNVNNDTMAVVDPIAANEIIKKIQQSLYQACIKQQDDQSPYKKIMDQQFNRLQELEKWSDTNVCNQDESQDVSTEMLNFMHNNSQNRSVREFRHFILESTANNDAYLKYEGYENKLHDFAKMTRAMFPTLPADDATLVTTMRQKFRLYYLKNSVIYTTGPCMILQTMFPQLIYHANEINTIVAPYAFESYGLDKIFKSQHMLPIHAPLEKEIELYNHEKIGDINDLSWLAEGVNAQKERETKINKSAITIQRFFRGYQVRKEMMTDSSFGLSNRATIKPL